MGFLVLKQLTKVYGDSTAVDALSLEIARGEFVSLLGPSGCGKTTTLQMIAGFIEPTAGAVILDGHDLGRTPPQKRAMGIVFQNYALFPHMTAAQNVAFGLEMRGVDKRERVTRVGEALALVGLGHLADRHPARMSGGQQQRVALARALVIRPSLLLLDEPLSNLDAKLREDMQIELRSIQRTVGTTTIMVTHDQSEALALSDRVVVMNQGRAEQVAEPYAAYEHPHTPFVGGFLGKANLFQPLVCEVDGRPHARIGTACMPLDGAAPPTATVIVRPEKVQFLAAGPAALPGRVKARIFQGNHWLCQVQTEVGDVLVIRQNDGVAVPAEGEAVHLGWRAVDMRPVTAGAGH